MTNSSTVVLKGTLKHHSVVYNAVEKAKMLIKNITRWELLKLSSRVTELVGCVIFTNVPQRYSVDRKALIVDILTELYSLNPDEVETLKNQVDDLVERNIIKKDSIFKQVGQYLYSWVLFFFK